MSDINRLHRPEDWGTGASISRSGQQPRAPLGTEGAPWYWEDDDSWLAQTQKCDRFPVAAVERLQQACFVWLYDSAPHVMACLERHWDDGEDGDEPYCMPGGSCMPRLGSNDEARGI